MFNIHNISIISFKNLFQENKNHLGVIAAKYFPLDYKHGSLHNRRE